MSNYNPIFHSGIVETPLKANTYCLHKCLRTPAEGWAHLALNFKGNPIQNDIKINLVLKIINQTISHHFLLSFANMLYWIVCSVFLSVLPFKTKESATKS